MVSLIKLMRLPFNSQNPKTSDPEITDFGATWQNLFVISFPHGVANQFYLYLFFFSNFFLISRGVAVWKLLSLSILL